MAALCQRPHRDSSSLTLRFSGRKRDFRVDIADAGLVGMAFGGRHSDTRWNANADLDSNDTIDVLDVALVAYYYGTKS